MSIRTNRQKPMMVTPNQSQPPMGGGQRPSAMKARPAAQPPQRPPAPPQQRPGPPLQQQQQQMQQQQQQPEKQQKPKMSIGDAIGLITIRLSRLETFIQQLQTDGIDMSSINGPGTGAGTIDQGMIQNLVSRLNVLEDSSHATTDTTATEQRIKTIETDLKDTKDLLMKLMLKFENFSDDTLVRFEEQHQLQETLAFNLEQLQQPESLEKPEEEPATTKEEETIPTPSNESEPVPSSG